jgi:hypothetical protein
MGYLQWWFYPARRLLAGALGDGLNGNSACFSRAAGRMLPG